MDKHPLRVALGPRGSGYVDPLVPQLYIPNNRSMSVGVPEGAPLENIKRAVKSGILIVVEGSLEDQGQPEEVGNEEGSEVEETEKDVTEDEEVEEVTEEDPEEEENKKCVGFTKSGNRCKNNALPGSDKCGLHADKE